MSKKILHIIIKSRYDGVTAYSTRLIKSLSGYEHQLLSCYKGPAYNEISKLNIQCHHLIDNGNISKWSVLIKYLRTISFFRRNRFNVIHYHHAGIGILLIAVLFKKRALILHHLHGGNLISDNTKQSISFAHRLILVWLSKHTLQIAVANHVFNEYKQKIRNINNLHVIKNAVPYKFACNKDIKNYIGYIGRSEPRKGFLIFGDISSGIKTFFPGIRFLMIGDNLKNNNSYIEQIPSSFQVNQFYQKIDLLLFTSTATEGLPLVILEAISFDVGVITRPLKGVVEILDDDYPLYFNNEEELKDKIKYFYSGNFNKAMLSKLHQEKLKEYSFDVMTRKIDRMYKSASAH